MTGDMTVRDSLLGRHVLVTGGGGYLGSLLVPALLQAGYEVSVIDLFIFGDESLRAITSHPRLHLYRHDIGEPEPPELFRDIDSVIHLASISNDPSCDLDPTLTIRSNYLATTALARRARAEGVQHFIFASSCSVYGAGSSRPLDELSHVGPVTLYALTKLASERELLELSSNDFRVTVLRFSTLFGLSPRMRFDLAVNSMTKRALQAKPIVVNGRGTQYRPFLHVADAADAILLVLRSDAVAVRGQVFNVGGDHLNFTIRGLADEVQLACPGSRIEHRELDHDIRSYRVRFQKIREALGFSPRRRIAHGVEEIALAARSGSFENMDAAQYYNVEVIKRSASWTVDGRWSTLSPAATPAAE